MGYTYETINVSKLFLNSKNYRIDFDRYKTEAEIVERLYEEEDIIEMIKGIVRFQGIYPHESLIAIPNNKNGYIVMEGNRRLLAVKTLLDIIKPPLKYESEVINLKSNLKPETLNSLSELRCVVYNVSDNEYLKIIADKHSAVNYARWGQISQWHFFKDTYISNNKDLEATAVELGKSKGEVSNYIRFHNLLSYIRSLPYWDQKGLRNEIEKNKLKPTKFTRPFGSRAVLNELNIEYGDDLELKIPNSNKAEFDYILCMYAEASLINDKSDDDYIYTRSEPPQVVELIKGWKEEYRKQNPGKSGFSPTNEGKNIEEKIKDGNGDGSSGGQNPGKEKPKKPDEDHQKGRNKVRYFSNLKCTVDEPHLIGLTDELTKINMTQFPAAAIMLTRSLIEAALLYQIDKKNMKKEYRNFLDKEHKKDGLKAILNFSIKNRSLLFDDPKSANGLEYLETSKYKDFMDDIVHSKWITPDETDVANIAGKIRELLRAIITDKA
ncbi:hypothetical protein ACNF40_06620 [Cuniculiplasma sp. SKW4]|uniref:hypothetical protein n=1 Tax=Cuniculiplasma sp. SKW4 TaxID=3400171 RepID=UPI003FD6315C